MDVILYVNLILLLAEPIIVNCLSGARIGLLSSHDAIRIIQFSHRLKRITNTTFTSLGKKNMYNNDDNF